MSMVWRSLRNLLRSPQRTTLMVALLAVSIGLALIMFTVHGATANQLGSIGTEIGTEITIRSAGSYGTMGGGEPLAQEDVDKLSSIDHVDSVQVSVQTQYSGDSLESAVDAGSLGGRGPMGGSSSGSFTMPITVMGFSAANESPTLMNGTTMEIVEGSYFTSDDADVMVVGQDLADKNSLSVGSTVDIEGTSVTVIGIYDSGTSFGNNMLIMPVDTVESLFDIDGVTSVTVVVDDIDNVDAVASDIREIFPEDVADVTTAEDMYARINDSVTNAGSTSTIGMIVAFSVAAIVVLFSVVLMMRQRVKEIGILKAIGASNRQIGFQFSLETLAVSLVGAIIGAIITYPLAQKVANMLAGGESTGMGGGPGGDMFSRVGGTVAGLDVAVSPMVFLYALAIAAALAILASVLPTWYIARVRPAEVLRNE
ncbi:MAG: hypothetical protein A2Y72_00725 [Chloroflexi bacterium RBG_13_53_26]|nr:MAG: hypothetical protein A2Y72_00725 [Chloroflexi bacterium RBG_13_53_26]